MPARFEDEAKITPRVVDFWTEGARQFLREFEASVAEGNSDNMMLAVAKLEQFGMCMSEFFEQIGDGLREDEQDVKTYDIATSAVFRACKDFVEKLRGMAGGEADEDCPDTVKNFN